jgi:hypothetical protein
MDGGRKWHLSYRLRGAVARHPTSIGYLRVLRGWRQNRCDGRLVVLCHIQQTKAVSGTSATILRRGWLRPGLSARRFFSEAGPARSHGKIPRLCSHLAAWPCLEAGVINHNPCRLSLTVASETACLLTKLRLHFLISVQSMMGRQNPEGGSGTIVFVFDVNCTTGKDASDVLHYTTRE